MASPMRFIVDQPVSPLIAASLRQAGHDAIHVIDRGMAAAPDTQIVALAEAEDRVVITQDNDFSALLALAASAKPSVIRFQMHDGRPVTQVRVLLANLQQLEADLHAGAIVVFEDAGIRVRRLPIARP